MKVFKIFVDMDKEEDYLRKMASQGWQFVRYSTWGFYTFQKAEPAMLNYRVDYRSFNNGQSFDEYVTLFDDAGWTHVGGTRSSLNQYFLPKPDAEQAEDIFSDRASKAARHKRLASIWGVVAFAWLAITFAYSVVGITSPDAQFFDYRSWYLTPGLWEKTGFDFWRAFWFETPFALLRSGWSFLLPLLMTVICGCWAVKAWWLYQRRR
jgi:hypothetical protein